MIGFKTKLISFQYIYLFNEFILLLLSGSILFRITAEVPDDIFEIPAALHSMILQLKIELNLNLN